MTVLGIETATPVCAVGCADEAGLAAENRIYRPNAHAESLPLLVRQVLEQTGIPADRLDGIAVSIGPGSFTGLRIGLGFAKGMAFALKKPLLAVPTADVVAAFAPVVCETACVWIPSGKREMLQALYRAGEDGWIPSEGVRVVPESEWGEGLPEGDILFLGDGATAQRDVLRRKRAECFFFPPAALQASGLAVAQEGLRLLRKGKAADPDSLVPLYFKSFQGIP